MREVRRLVILDWLLSGTGERWTRHADHLSEVDRAQARAILESQRTGLREALRRAMQECYGAAAPSPGTLAEDAAPRPGAGQPGLAASPRPPRSARTWPRRSATWSTRRSPRPIRGIRGSSRPTSRSPCGIWPRCTRTWSGRSPTRTGGSGWRATSPRSAGSPTPLQVGMAGETHFLFGDDRFGPWGAEFERAAARDGLQPQDPVTVGRIRGWIDAMRPELGLRDEVADLIMLAWAALRQRAWYQHGASVPAPAAGRDPAGHGTAARAAAAAGRLADGDVARRVAVRDPGQPVPHRGWRRRVHRESPQSRGHAGRPGRCSGRARWSAPTSTSACPLIARRAGWRPPAPGPALVEALRRPSSRVHLVETLARTRAARHRNRGGELAEPGAACRRRGGRVPVGPARAAAHVRGPGRRARPGGRQHPDDAARGGGGGRVRDPAGTRARRCRRCDLRVASRRPDRRTGGSAPTCRARTTSSSPCRHQAGS